MSSGRGWRAGRAARSEFKSEIPQARVKLRTLRARERETRGGGLGVSPAMPQDYQGGTPVVGSGARSFLDRK